MATALEIRKMSGNLKGCLNIKVLPFLRFNLLISVSIKMPYQEVREISLRSGKSQEIWKLNKWPPYL